MNYEQKYKEALKIIESLYNVVRYQSSSDALLVSQTIEKAFPELCESEDERIKKELISFFTKRQGEQKHTPKYKIGDCIEYRGERYKITNVTVTANNFYYDVSLIKEPSDWEEVVAAIGMAAEEKMFKIEQKPAWSEEDEKFLVDTMNFLYRAKNQYAQITRLEECIDWLKSLKPNHWKPSKEYKTAYVVTRSEEHCDYVEKVFFDKGKAEEYCKPFNEDKNSYHRDITKIEVSL